MKRFLAPFFLFFLCYSSESDDSSFYRLSETDSKSSLVLTDWGSDDKFTNWGSDDESSLTRVSTLSSGSSLRFGPYSETETFSSVHSEKETVTQTLERAEKRFNEEQAKRPNAIIAKYMLARMFEQKQMVGRVLGSLTSKKVLDLQVAHSQTALTNNCCGLLYEDGTVDVWRYNKLESTGDVTWDHILDIEHKKGFLQRQRALVTAFRLFDDAVITSAPQSDTRYYKYNPARHRFELRKTWRQKRPLRQVEKMKEDFYFLGDDKVFKQGTIRDKKKIFFEDGVEEIAVNKEQDKIVLLKDNGCVKLFNRKETGGVEPAGMINLWKERLEEPYLSCFIDNSLYIGSLQYLTRNMQQKGEKAFSISHLFYDTRLGKTEETAAEDMTWATNRMLKSVVLPTVGSSCIVSDQDSTQLLLDTDSGAAFCLNQFLLREEVLGLDGEHQLLFTRKDGEITIRSLHISDLLLYSAIKALDVKKLTGEEINQIKRWCLQCNKETFFDSENPLVQKLDDPLKALLKERLEYASEETPI